MAELKHEPTYVLTLTKDEVRYLYSALHLVEPASGDPDTIFVALDAGLSQHDKDASEDAAVSV